MKVKTQLPLHTVFLLFLKFLLAHLPLGPNVFFDS